VQKRLRFKSFCVKVSVRKSVCVYKASVFVKKFLCKNITVIEISILHKILYLKAFVQKPLCVKVFLCKKILLASKSIRCTRPIKQFFSTKLQPAIDHARKKKFLKLNFPNSRNRDRLNRIWQ
jgi:hypothetical protein